MIVVAGAIANTAHKGGDTWHRLHWLLGLRRLGARVHLVEQIDQAACVDASGASTDVLQSVNLAYFRSVVATFGLTDAATLLDGNGNTAHGLGLSDVRSLVKDATLLINISGHLDLGRLGLRPRLSVFIDEDPGFTQIWHATGTRPIETHDYYYSVGWNIGTGNTNLPTGSIPWRPLRPFAVLDEWPLVPRTTLDRFTTVGSWRGPFGTVEYAGATYGVKAHEFRRFFDLPQLTGSAFELALDVHPNETRDLARLRQTGWRLVDPLTVACDPCAFRAYVQGSGAEFSVAKGIYVATNSGWFSDRTIRYLASGRPVLVQDTGFSAHYPVGMGLLSFRTLEDAAEGVRRIERDYGDHAEAARAIAEQHFNSDDVLGQLLEQLAVGS